MVLLSQERWWARLYACKLTRIFPSAFFSDSHSILFKYAFSSYAEKRMRQKIKWAAVARLAQESGFWGVLVIRYSVVPPRESSNASACHVV